MKRIVSGIKPTGELHLGHYIGAIDNFVKYQDEYEMFIFIANLHAITVHNEPKDLRNRSRSMLALYLACGLDPEKVNIFLQSEILEHAQLGYIMQCMSYMGELSRMTQYKDKSTKEKNIGSGIFTYPTLMAADILLYDADVVPVGDDQKQHVELTRDLAERFNNRYSPTFTVPEPLIGKVGARIMSLNNPTKKMSKSDDDANKACIFLLDDLNTARKKIMSAVTDNDKTIKYDQENKPGISNLLTIYSSLTNKSIADLEIQYQNSSYADFKKDLAEIVVSFLSDIQEKYNYFMNKEIIDTILNNGREKASIIARKKMRKVEYKIGLRLER